MSSSISCCDKQTDLQRPFVVNAHLTPATITHLYDRIAPFYDLWAGLTETRARRRALQLADIHDGQHLLEVAVGTGLAFAELVRRNPNGVNLGIDLSPGMLARARRRLARQNRGNHTLRLGDARRLEVGDARFDSVLNSYMFDLIPFEKMGPILAEFKRVLKPGGKLVLVNMTTGERCGSGIFAWLYRISPKLMGGCRGVRMAALLDRHGFQVVTREYHQQLGFPSEVILARKTLRA
ncbi:MAG: methyltransferase domain-containing protein [Desulfosarcinaceae bacterium]|nr:methyltransferase domain-containing protein [Desulfosarcinaceae bacterium]